jgi:hypothetical protein
MSIIGGRVLFAFVVATNVVLFAFSPLQILQHAVNAAGQFVATHRPEISENTAADTLIVAVELSLVVMSLLSRRSLKRSDWISKPEFRVYVAACGWLAIYNMLFLVWYVGLWVDND